MRLDKFICKSTDLDRSRVAQLIVAGEVSVNGHVVIDVSRQVHENNDVILNGMTLETRAFRYIQVHKAQGTICSNIDEAYPSVFNTVDVDNVSELHVAGRLDVDTSGLVLVTDDGRWSFNIIRPEQQCNKIYRVGLRDPVSVTDVQQFLTGIQLQGERQFTRPAELERIKPREVLLTITEGKYHQVKRMFAAVGNRVISLHREQIGEVRLDVAVGEWRYLTADEVESFNQVPRCTNDRLPSGHHRHY